MEVVVAAEVPVDERNDAASVRGGGPNSHIRQPLLGDDAPDGLSFTFSRSQWLSGDDHVLTNPRHHHAFQQIRWTESGKVNYGPNQDIVEGDVGYFPRGAYYGPQVRDQGIVLTLQFGFHGEKQAGGGYWEQYQKHALEKLHANGTFRSGVYIDIDPMSGEERVRDGVQALYDEQYFAATGREFVVPDEGYHAPIHLHTGAFTYYESAPGVEIKRLGDFFDHPGPRGDVRLSLIRLSNGGVTTFGADRAQLAWTKSPGLTINGTTYPELTFVYCPRNEQADVSGDDPLELNVVEFPRLD
ncbi:MAG TPA: hypothetical protein VG246_09955 [Acidimicrobiales bacterium]|jgi:hypothetical protein|nr:hypothetical protein [Acidimicrobiales bacterium]